MINLQILDDKLLYLGFREVTCGTDMLRFAIKVWRPGMKVSKELYPMVAKQFGSTIPRAERAMRHAIESAWERGDPTTIDHCFGYTISADKGKPTVGEFVSRMARVCADED